MRGGRLMANANTRGKRFEVGLSDKKGSTMNNDLKILLKAFKREEISLKQFAKVMLEDPILLLAQQRSFRIYRREFFCPIQDCRPHKLITSLGKLATHIHIFHFATK
jgi:hypothetical protein